MYFCLTAIRKVVPLSPNLLAILSISGAKKEEMWAPNLQWTRGWSGLYLL